MTKNSKSAKPGEVVSKEHHKLGRSDWARKEKLARVAELLVSGWTHSEIGREMGVTQQTVSEWKETIEHEWANTPTKQIMAIRNRELAKIDQLERELWAAWRKSCKDAEEMTTTREGILLEGAVPGDKALEQVRQQQHVKGQSGDPRYMQALIECSALRMKIVGGFAPQTHAIIDWRAEISKQGQDAEAVFDWLVTQIVSNASAVVDGTAVTLESGE